ncbi:Gfo/Idh/MocA family protein [Gracilibacillus salinarum]|uniref:Gfo/Idh/MocA family oxidoreductase n=1 Tax=Gracilibacillus salinarum TaxID=2932255 RepID=A0ABY4GRD3_9BACI|nr:Gfo/Idh/MocA family oxidoreductase [Gracilibacillus salinarum]UOQ86746.1 Gfo/Idh/MocA family oxidoreductase [Gracilibacillus salinarum]
MKVGIIGCGNISKIYLENATRFANYSIEAVADLVLERAQERAEQYHIPKAYTTEQLLDDPEIDFVINLTIPAVHAEIAIKALEKGKHVYGEKPLAVSLEDGQRMIETAEEKGLMIGNAPDTFLGAGIQTSRKLIDDGWIGRPLSATAFMMIAGHERWHPDPAFYYQEGGGPMFDMGPYYLHALVNLLGPVARVTGSAQMGYTERTIMSQPKFGESIKVETPTQINSVLDFEKGPVASMIMSFDTHAHQLPHIEIYGTEGTLSVPDPNTFGGPVYLRRHDHKEWQEIPLSHGFSDNSRGLGVAEMVDAIQAGKSARANGDLSYHVLEIMHGILSSSTEGKHQVLSSSCVQPDALPIGFDEKHFFC